MPEPQAVPVLEVVELTKAYSGVVANKDVSLRVHAGETRAILGENGAGKSTLMRCLYGLQQPDSGVVRVDGVRVDLDSPRTAMRHGIGMVSQEFALIDTMTVAENVALAPGDGGAPTVLRGFRRAAVERKIRELAEEIGLTVDPTAVVGDLSIGVQQRVEILKALYNDSKVLMLDEPTAMLSPIEVEALFTVVDELNSRGAAVLFVSHKLDEVLRLAHNVTVLRHGRVVAEMSAEGLTKQALGMAMLGSEMRSLATDTRQLTTGRRILDVSGIRISPAPRRRPLHDVSLTVHDAEIVGVAGVDGNGQTELAEVVVGLRRPEGGTVLLDDEDVTGLDARQMVARGVGYVPQDRRKVGSVGKFDVADNVILKQFRSARFSRRGWQRRTAADDCTRELVDAFDVRVSSRQNPVSTLSGGNLQKLVLAREIGLDHQKLVVAMDPTRGVDFNAATAIWGRLRDLRAAGAAVLVFSSDLDDMLANSDRIAVMSGGRIVDVLDRADVTLEKLALLMGGSVVEAGEQPAAALPGDEAIGTMS